MSYVILVLLVLYSSLQFPSDEINRDQFSLYYPLYAKNFSFYTANGNLTYRFQVNDFFIRRNRPSTPDIVISIWLAGD